MTLSRRYRRVTRHRHSHSGSKRMVGGRRRKTYRRVHRRQRGRGNGYDITGNIPLLGGLIQSIGNAIHHGTDW